MSPRSWTAPMLALAAWFASALGLPAQTDAGLPKVQLRDAFPALRFQRPLWMQQAPDDSNREFLLEQRGMVWVFERDAKVAKASKFLDWTGHTGIPNEEEGLLAMAFHPKYRENGKFYLYYSAQNPRRTVLSEFQVAPGHPDQANPASQRVLLEVLQPFVNHKGGTLLFGKDNYLYLSLGDGGSAGDPHGNGQSLKTLLAKIIRIDVDRRQDRLPYGIPADNPFVGHRDARGEIWAYGLRNVWRMSFDRETGELWAADVGQDAWEEIDLIRKGGDYGWNFREGMHPYALTPPPPSAQLIDPIAEYGHADGVCITGGYVYRGARWPKLKGVYLYADYVFGTIRGLREEKGQVTLNGVLLRQPKNISSFAEDRDGELYAIAFDGKVYAIEAP